MWVRSVYVCVYVCIQCIVYSVYSGYGSMECMTEDNVAEWLRRLPAKQFPFGSVGSNPAVVVFYI